MTLDDSTSHHLHELLEQARYELRSCKKSLAFKESLLTDLELENAELADAKEKLDRELQCLKRQESRRSEFERASDDCVDDGYGHWSHDEDDFPPSPTTEIEKAQPELGRCSTCETHDRERNELFERIEELQQQLDIAQEVNKALQEDVTQKAAQIADLTEALLRKQVREEQLEADLEFTAAERETALKDLHDSQMTFFSSRRNSVEYFRSSSIGSSLAEELGLDTKEIQQLSPSFVDWDELLAEPEASDSDLRFAERSRENLGEADSSPLDHQEDKLPEEPESSLNVAPEDGNVTEGDAQLEPTDLSSRRHQDEWKNIQYSGEFSFGWRSLVCCVPEPGTPIRKENIVGAKAKNARKGFLSFLKRRSGGKN